MGDAAQKVKVLYHGHCFDGFSSAAIFTRFYRECVDATATFEYQGMRHGSPDPIDVTLLDGDVNALVDFRYSPSPRLDWWWDHHRSAFVTDEERAHFDATPNPHHHWDSTAPSCAGYLARTCAEEHGFDTGPLAELIKWADVIDAARYPDARTAVALEAPAMKLAAICEGLGDGPDAVALIEDLAGGSLAALVDKRQWVERFAPIKASQAEGLQLVRERLEVFGDVIFIDLTGQSGVAVNKFASYFLAPEATYVVMVSSLPAGVKLSVGSNPWRPEARRHDLSEICERFGGGGHAVVGGVTVPDGTDEDGRRIGREIVALLGG